MDPGLEGSELPEPAGAAPGLEGSKEAAGEAADAVGMLRRFEPALRGVATGRHTEWLSIRAPVYRSRPGAARAALPFRVSLHTPARGVPHGFSACCRIPRESGRG